jgi:hypothetical protein
MPFDGDVRPHESDPLVIGRDGREKTDSGGKVRFTRL